MADKRWFHMPWLHTPDSLSASSRRTRSQPGSGRDGVWGQTREMTSQARTNGRVPGGLPVARPAEATRRQRRLSTDLAAQGVFGEIAAGPCALLRPSKVDPRRVDPSRPRLLCSHALLEVSEVGVKHSASAPSPVARLTRAGAAVASFARERVLLGCRSL